MPSPGSGKHARDAADEATSVLLPTDDGARAKRQRTEEPPERGDDTTDTTLSINSNNTDSILADSTTDHANRDRATIELTTKDGAISTVPPSDSSTLPTPSSSTNAVASPVDTSIVDANVTTVSRASHALDAPDTTAPAIDEPTTVAPVVYMPETPILYTSGALANRTLSLPAVTAGRAGESWQVKFRAWLELLLRQNADSIPHLSKKKLKLVLMEYIDKHLALPNDKRAAAREAATAIIVQGTAGRILQTELLKLHSEKKKAKATEATERKQNGQPMRAAQTDETTWAAEAGQGSHDPKDTSDQKTNQTANQEASEQVPPQEESKDQEEDGEVEEVGRKPSPMAPASPETSSSAIPPPSTDLTTMTVSSETSILSASPPATIPSVNTPQVSAPHVHRSGSPSPEETAGRRKEDPAQPMNTADTSIDTFMDPDPKSTTQDSATLHVTAQHSTAQHAIVHNTAAQSTQKEAMAPPSALLSNTVPHPQPDSSAMIVGPSPTASQAESPSPKSSNPPQSFPSLSVPPSTQSPHAPSLGEDPSVTSVAGSVKSPLLEEISPVDTITTVTADEWAELLSLGPEKLAPTGPENSTGLENAAPSGYETALDRPADAPLDPSNNALSQAQSSQDQSSQDQSSQDSLMNKETIPETDTAMQIDLASDSESTANPTDAATGTHVEDKKARHPVAAPSLSTTPGTIHITISDSEDSDSDMYEPETPNTHPTPPKRPPKTTDSDTSSPSDGEIDSDSSPLPHANSHPAAVRPVLSKTRSPSPAPPSTPPPPPPPPPASSPLRHKPLVSRAEEAELQNLYFDGDDRSERCIHCFATHALAQCPSFRCRFCASQDHRFYQCPSVQRCTRCLHIGHDVRACTEKWTSQPTRRIPAADAHCAYCQARDHLEPDCPDLWYTYSMPASVERVSSLAAYCAYCGERGHYYTECAGVDKDDGDTPKSRTWSQDVFRAYHDPTGRAQPCVSAQTQGTATAKRSTAPRRQVFVEEEDDSEDADFFQLEASRTSARDDPFPPRGAGPSRKWPDYSNQAEIWDASRGNHPQRSHRSQQQQQQRPPPPPSIPARPPPSHPPPSSLPPKPNTGIPTGPASAAHVKKTGGFSQLSTSTRTGNHTVGRGPGKHPNDTTGSMTKGKAAGTVEGKGESKAESPGNVEKKGRKDGEKKEKKAKNDTEKNENKEKKAKKDTEKNANKDKKDKKKDKEKKDNKKKDKEKQKKESKGASDGGAKKAKKTPKLGASDASAASTPGTTTPRVTPAHTPASTPTSSKGHTDVGPAPGKPSAKKKDKTKKTA